MQGHGVLKPQNMSYKPPRKSNTPARPQAPNQPREQQPEQEEQPPIDPSLISMYPEPQDNGPYGDGHYSYPTNAQAQNYNLLPQSYNMPSLEQIANEVLVDMNGNEYHDQNAQHPNPREHGHVFESPDAAPLPNGHSKPDESVDSAVSLPTTEVLEQKTSETTHPKAQEQPKTEADIESRLVHALSNSGLPPAHPSIETNGVQVSNEPTSPDRPKSGASNLPLYQPPAPLSQSPDSIKRQPVMPNGINQGKSSSPVEATPAKHKRDSNSATSGTSTKSAKKLKVDGVERQSSREPSGQTEEEKQSMELAKMLQQEELGLRRRSK